MQHCVTLTSLEIQCYKAVTVKSNMCIFKLYPAEILLCCTILLIIKGEGANWKGFSSKLIAQNFGNGNFSSFET